MTSYVIGVSVTKSYIYIYSKITGSLTAKHAWPMPSRLYVDDTCIRGVILIHADS